MREHDFFGYRRENGRVGVRNHVLLLPLDAASSVVAAAVGGVIPGVLTLPHADGRPEVGEDLLLRTLIGTGANPNVAACIVIGSDPEWAERVARGIGSTGKPVADFAINGAGDLTTTRSACRAAKELVQAASGQQRESCSIPELFVGIACSESDATCGLAACPAIGAAVDKLTRLQATICFGPIQNLAGAEQMCAARAVGAEAGDRFMQVATARFQPVDRPGPSARAADALTAGLTTLEEKALGMLQAIGKEPLFIDVLEPAGAPAKGPGLYLMDTPAAPAECITLQAAAGCVVHVCTTGQGGVIGNPIVPVIRLTANPLTVRAMREHIDLDLSGLLRRQLTVPVAGDILLERVLRTCSGRLTSAEALGHREFALAPPQPRP